MKWKQSCINIHLSKPENSLLKTSVNYPLKTHKNTNVWHKFLKLFRFWYEKLFYPTSENLLCHWKSHQFAKFLIPTTQICPLSIPTCSIFQVFWQKQHSVIKNQSCDKKLQRNQNIFSLKELKISRFAHFAKTARTQSKLPICSFFNS